jgi:molecular chaperone DnaK
MSTAIAGIDLGTTFSAISILNDIGRPEVVPNCDGDRIMPSAVFFVEGEAERIVTGVEAINSRYENSERCVRWIKREMGETDYRVSIDGHEWAPSEISAAILKKLTDDASVALGKPVKDVIITVPSNFGELARQATMEAGRIAGLNVLGLINEPTAAAMYYAISHQISGRIMVFDLGGGTFDVSVADINGPDVQIVCSLGDRHLGGRDFDEALLAYFSDLYREETGEDLYVSDEDRAEIEDYLEEIKKSLSRRESAKVRLTGDGGILRTEITREKFEELIAPSLAKIEMLVENIFEECECDPQNFTSVILVGGSSRIPCVQHMLTRMFGFEPLVVGNVDECVSLGAALCAGFRVAESNPELLSEGMASGMTDVKLSDVCNHSYGTTALQKDPLTGKPELSNIILIPKNTPIPCEVSQLFLTMAANQVSISADVTQGEGHEIRHVDHLAQEILELPPDRPAGQRIKITYSYDVNQKMHCIFEDVSSGNRKVIKIDTTLSPTKSQGSSEDSQDLLSRLIIE